MDNQLARERIYVPVWCVETHHEEKAEITGEKILRVDWDQDKPVSTVKYFALRYSSVNPSMKKDYGDFFRVQLKELATVTAIDGAQKPIVSFSRDSVGYRDWSNSVQVVVDHVIKQAKLGPTGNILVAGDLRGQGLGRFLLSEVIVWLQYHYPTYGIAKGKLGPGDADKENIERRDHFYRSPGFIVVYADGDRCSGHFFAEKISELTPYHPVNLRVLSAPDMLQDLLKQQDENNDLKTKLMGWKKLYESLERDFLKSRRWNRRFAVFLVVLVAGVTFYTWLSLQ